MGMVASDNCGIHSIAQTPLPGTKVGIGSTIITITATDTSGNSTACHPTFKVQYQPAGVSCNGNPGHTILQPVNADGTSVFKQGSTVPLKFMVFDANCDSIGTPGVVSGFTLVSATMGASALDEAIVSTTPDTAFRWDPTGQQWIFNLSTKNLTKNYTYVYRITLNDASTIQFSFGLK